MNYGKKRFLLPVWYLTVTLLCGIAGWVLQDDSGTIFFGWYGISVIIWLVYGIRSIWRIGRRKRK